MPACDVASAAPPHPASRSDARRKQGQRRTQLRRRSDRELGARSPSTATSPDPGVAQLRQICVKTAWANAASSAPTPRLAHTTRLADAPLERLADARVGVRPAAEVPVPAVRVVLRNVVREEDLACGDGARRDVEVEVDRQEQHVVFDPRLVSGDGGSRTIGPAVTTICAPARRHGRSRRRSRLRRRVRARSGTASKA